MNSKIAQMDRKLASSIPLDTEGTDALAWDLRQGFAPPPPVALPEGVYTLRRAPRSQRGAIFLPARYPLIEPE